MPDSRAADAPESVAPEVTSAIRKLRASMRNEALGSIGIGLALIVITYWVFFVFLLNGVGYGLSFFGYGGLFSAWLGPALSSTRLGIAGIWFVIATVSAWLQVLPLAAPQPAPGKSADPFLDPPPSRVVRSDDDSGGNSSGLMAVSLGRALMQCCIGGPRNIFEGVATLRDIPKVNDAIRARATQLLVLAASQDGLNAKNLVRDEVSAGAMALLWRLRLIMKQPTFSSRWKIVASPSGQELAHA